MKIGLQDKNTGRYYPIKANHVRIGSAESCQIVLDDRSVAEFHAEVHITDIGIELHHKGRDRGTWINEDRVTRYFLSNHDRICFGSLVLDFVLGDDTMSGQEQCARCGVEIATGTTRRYITRASEGAALCAQCEARRSGRSASPPPQERRRPATESEGFNDPYGLLRDLDKPEDDLTRSLEDMPDLAPISVIAKGAQGVIHKMRYKGQIVAVKRLKFDVKSNAKERFLREMKALRALDHPSLVRLIDSIEHDRSAYLIMEYIDGPSLEILIERNKQIPVKSAINYAINVASGLVYLASQGIIHRDIKPSNVLIDPKDTARLVDFGLVRFTTSTHMLTAPGQMVGSPSYMSPEQVRAQTLTAKSDIFSLGVMFFEALTGRRPFPGNTPIELFTAILEDPPPLELLVSLNPKLPEVFAGLLAKDPKDRPTPEEALAQLQALAAS